jgi:ribonuclease G
VQKSPETVCYEIFREIMRVARAYENDVLLVMASQLVVDRLLDDDSAALADLEELVGKTVKFEVEPMYTQEQFDVVLF